MSESKEFIPYKHPHISPADMISKSQEHFVIMDKRRTLRMFSDKPVPKLVIENVIKTASTAPSGAHKQPWTFCAIANPDVKKKIRIAAEKEEHINYNGRMSDEWLKDLEAFGTDEHKPFLEIAPWLIVVFRHNYAIEEGEKKKNYYVQESVGIATGFLLSAIHHAGLVSLTHTPSPMNFLGQLLDRPTNEKAFLLIPVGYPSEEATVPNLRRKTLEEMSVFYE